MIRAFFLVGALIASAYGEALSDIVDIKDGEIYVVDGDEVNEACLTAHNNIRDLHQIDQLEFSQDLADSSAEWAKYNLENQFKPAHHAAKSVRKAGKFGENIFRKASFEPTGVENAVLAWYNEHFCWDYDTGKKIKDKECKSTPTGHLTQEIWAGTTKVGCGMAVQAKDYEVGGRSYRILITYIVARYNPPGNKKSIVGINVFPPDEDVDLPDSPDDLVEDSK